MRTRGVRSWLSRWTRLFIGRILVRLSSNMVIVFQRGDEEPQAFPLGKPGGDISIAWGEPTRRDAIWKVVASPNGNVYVMERKTGSYLKASLHQSKIWRYAWVERAAESSPMVQSFVEATGDRVIDRWDRPQRSQAAR
jgi:hypothetical protein